jgi:uncharacterized membrane protein YheB (UPF0754 family)
VEKTDQIKFVHWLTNRLINVYGYATNDRIIVLCQDLLNSLASPQKIIISAKDLDKIIAKYYSDFYLDKIEELNIGFSDNERNNLRSTIRCIVSDIINMNIPKEPLIKD